MYFFSGRHTPFDIKVTLGQYDTCLPDVSSYNVSIDSIQIHPDFNSANRAHDLGLLRVSHVITFERRINPICLPTHGKWYTIVMSYLLRIV